MVMDIMKRFFKNEAGSFTVEAALVMSAVIIVLSFFILAYLLMYQKVLLTRNAIKTAREGANLWVAKDQGLYYRISEGFISEKAKSISYDKTNSKTVEKKLLLIKDYADNEFKRGLIVPEHNQVLITFDNAFSYRELVVKMNQEIKSPLGKLKANFNEEENISIHAAGKSVIAEPAEYIRNLDLFLELAQKNESINECLSVLGNSIK